MTRVRFAPSPTGTLHVGNALSAVANRRLGDYLLLRIDDTDPARNVPGGEEAIEADLGWLGGSSMAAALSVHLVRGWQARPKPYGIAG